MTYSNLSKIRPKLRTSGNVTGNFGRPKSKAGSPLQEIGMSNKEMKLTFFEYVKYHPMTYCE